MTDHEIIHNLNHRLDRQDQMLMEIRDKINAHLIESDNMRPALDELVAMWKGSKLIIPIMSGLAAMIWGVWSWGKEHLR